MHSAEKRTAAAARKKLILDPYSDHLVFVQVFRVSCNHGSCLVCFCVKGHSLHHILVVLATGGMSAKYGDVPIS